MFTDKLLALMGAATQKSTQTACDTHTILVGNNIVDKLTHQDAPQIYFRVSNFKKVNGSSSFPLFGFLDPANNPIIRFTPRGINYNFVVMKSPNLNSVL